MQYLCDNNVPFCPGPQWALAQGNQHSLQLRWGSLFYNIILLGLASHEFGAKTTFLPAVPGCGLPSPFNARPIVTPTVQQPFRGLTFNLIADLEGIRLSSRYTQVQDYAPRRMGVGPMP